MLAISKRIDRYMPFVITSSDFDIWSYGENESFMLVLIYTVNII